MDLIKQVYFSNDKFLIRLFKIFLPIPRKFVFDGELPEFLKYEFATESENVVKFIQKIIQSVWLTRQRVLTLQQVEDMVIKMQRKFRAKHRATEEVMRLKQVYEVS